MNNTVNRASLGAKKNKIFKSGFCEKLKLLLIPIGLLIGNFTTQVWGNVINSSSGANAYFDNTNSNWSNSVWYFGIGQDKKNVTLWQMGEIEHTKLIKVGLDKWDNADFFFVSNPNNTWGETTYEHMSGNVTQTTGEYRAPVEGNYTFDKDHYYLLIPAGGSHETSFSCTHKGTSYTAIGQFDQTVNVVVNGNSSPSTSPASISIKSYYWSAWDAVTESTATDITQGGTTITKTWANAAYTAETTMQVTSTQSGYNFVGWYDAATGGSLVSDANPYTYYPREANTLYARFENIYVISVSAGDHGTITTGAGNITAGYYTNPTITAETYGDNKDQYRFEKWVCTGGASVANANSATTTVSATSTGTVTAKFVSVWCLKGGNSASEDGSDALGDWKVNNSLDYTGTSYVYSASIPLAANTTYEFQLWDYPNSTWYRYGGSNSYTLAFIGQTDASLALHSPDESNKMNLRVLTAGEGNYTFTWNSNTKTLTVGYPTVTHPSSDYVYFKDVLNWSSNISAHVFTDSNNPKTGWNRVPLMSSFSFGGETYYYAALGGETSCLFASGTDTPGTKTDDLTEASLNKGKWYNPSTKTWNPFTISVTLNNQGATTPGAANVTATYNAAMPSIEANKPSKTGYDFQGYYASTGGSGTQYYTNTGASAHVWDQTCASPRIYAHWTQIMVSEIALDHTDESLYKGETLTITPTVTPDNALNKDVNWSTSAEGVATVENGVVTAVAPGTATITATAADGSGITANCEITVGYKVTYDANGESGSVPNDATYYANNASVTVLGNTGPLSKEDYTFRCWNTQADGYGTDYAPGATFNITDNTTLYAKWTKNDYIGKYTFHYGTSTGGGVNDFAGTWTVRAFPDEPSRTMGTIEDYTNYYDLTGFTIPDPSTAPHYFIGYEGWPKTQLGEHSATPSKVRAWSAKYSENNGYMNVKPGSIVISDGDTKTAVGAVGTLTIENSNRTGGENLNIGFSPNGYVLTIRNSSEEQTRTLSFTKVAGTDEIWETEILNDGLTAAEVAGTFKVGLATASGATDCFQSEWAAASVLNANKDEFVGVVDDNVDNYPDLAAGVKGRFQLVRVYKGGNTLRNKQNFALRYVTMKNWTIDPVLAWSQPGKWSLGHQPTIDEDVVVYHNTTISNNNAVAKRVRIHKDGGYHTLTISPYGGLLVAEDIKAYHESAEDKDDEDYSATTSSDLLIETNSYGNGSLICGSASTTSEATYYFYSKSYKYDTWFVNQFVGIPFVTCDAWDYYGMNIYEYDAEKDDWKTPGSYTLNSFTTYNMINKYNGGATTYTVSGVLSLPGTSGTKTLTCGSRHDVEFNGDGDYMFANSWTAPIDISTITAEDYENILGEVHIFNAGYTDPTSDAKKVIGDLAGQWTVFSFNSAPYLVDPIIPATQAFLITATDEGGWLKLDYGKHVYTPASAGGANTTPTRAPRRNNLSDAPAKLRIKVSNESDIADQIYIFEREDFTEAYDNGWDGTKLLGNITVPQLYTEKGDLKLSIDATPEMDGTLIGFKAGTDDYEYTFSFEYDDDEPLYLYDKETQDFTRISNEATYTFQTKDNAEHSRFALTRSNAPQIVTAFENAEYEAEIRAEKFIENNMLFIRRGDKVYSIDGTQVK